MYKVYYQKNPSFRANKNLISSDVKTGRVFTFVGRVNADSPEDAYRQMQGEFMTHINKALLTEARVRDGIAYHTSMSVGDCLIEERTGKKYQCCNFGFEEVPERGV